MANLILLAALMLQQAPAAPPDQVDPVMVEALAQLPAAPGLIPDAEIQRQLNALLVKEPDRVICVYKTSAGSRIPRPICQTLRGWYNFEAARNTAARRGGGDGDGDGVRPPPYEIVQLIKARMRNPKTRAMAEARAGARLQAEARARAEEP
jgi:hypothetical protein